LRVTGGLLRPAWHRSEQQRHGREKPSPVHERFSIARTC
jgi:hypothetical protein